MPASLSMRTSERCSEVGNYLSHQLSLASPSRAGPYVVSLVIDALE